TEDCQDRPVERESVVLGIEFEDPRKCPFRFVSRRQIVVRYGVVEVSAAQSEKIVDIGWNCSRSLLQLAHSQLELGLIPAETLEKARPPLPGRISGLVPNRPTENERDCAERESEYQSADSD